MIGHERILSAIRLTQSPNPEAYYQGLWGTVEVERQHGVVVEGVISDPARDGTQTFATRTFKLYKATPGAVIQFENGTYTPIGEEGKDFEELSLNGPDPRTRSVFRRAIDAAAQTTYIEGGRDDNTFRIVRGLAPTNSDVPGTRGLNGQTGDFLAEMVAQTSGTYLEMLERNARIQEKFGEGVSGLVAATLNIEPMGEAVPLPV